jgi:hypothetical protein
MAAILEALLVPGCGSIVSQSCRGAPAPPAPPNVALMPYSGSTRVYGSVNPDDDGARLAQEGFAQSGISSFKTDGHVTFERLQNQAR